MESYQSWRCIVFYIIMNETVFYFFILVKSSPQRRLPQRSNILKKKKIVFFHYVTSDGFTRQKFLSNSGEKFESSQRCYFLLARSFHRIVSNRKLLFIFFRFDFIATRKFLISPTNDARVHLQRVRFLRDACDDDVFATLSYFITLFVIHLLADTFNSFDTTNGGDGGDCEQSYTRSSSSSPRGRGRRCGVSSIIIIVVVVVASSSLLNFSPVPFAGDELAFPRTSRRPARIDSSLFLTDYTAVKL